MKKYRIKERRKALERSQQWLAGQIGYHYTKINKLLAGAALALQPPTPDMP